MTTVSSSPRVTRGYGLLEGFLANRRSDRANRLIPLKLRQGRILDVGCGTTPVFLRSTEFAEKYGVDKVAQLSEDTVQRDGIRLTNHDLEADPVLPFADDYFDVVSMLAVFEHIEPAMLTKTLSEVHRILKPDGAYILTTPAFWTPGLLKLLAKLRVLSTMEIYEHKGAYTRVTIAALLEEAGFLRENLSLGYFEMGANIWVLARKSTQHSIG